MASSQDWRSALPELSQEWTPQPAPTSLGSMPEQVDFGSVVLSDTLQIRPAIARQGTIQESVPGTMVIHNSRDQDPENPLAWAAKGAATNLLHSQQSTYQEPQDAKQQRKNNLQSLFEPPTPAQPESSPHRSFVYLWTRTSRAEDIPYQTLILPLKCTRHLYMLDRHKRTRLSRFLSSLQWHYARQPRWKLRDRRAHSSRFHALATVDHGNP